MRVQIARIHNLLWQKTSPHEQARFLVQDGFSSIPVLATAQGVVEVSNVGCSAQAGLLVSPWYSQMHVGSRCKVEV